MIKKLLHSLHFDLASFLGGALGYILGNILGRTLGEYWIIPLLILLGIAVVTLLGEHQ